MAETGQQIGCTSLHVLFYGIGRNGGNDGMLFEVIVGNIGLVYSGNSQHTAVARFDNYVANSKADVGRAAGESVYLMQDGQPINEHQGPADDE